jgi:hypothetical protein
MAKETGPVGAAVQAGVWSASGAFHPALVSARDPGGRTLAVAVPSGATVRLSVMGRAFDLLDDRGTTVESHGRTIAIAVPANGPPPKVAFTLGGPKSQLMP